MSLVLSYRGNNFAFYHYERHKLHYYVKCIAVFFSVSYMHGKLNYIHCIYIYMCVYLCVFLYNRRSCTRWFEDFGRKTFCFVHHSIINDSHPFVCSTVLFCVVITSCHNISMKSIYYTTYWNPFIILHVYTIVFYIIIIFHNFVHLPFSIHSFLFSCFNAVYVILIITLLQRPIFYHTDSDSV